MILHYFWLQEFIQQQTQKTYEQAENFINLANTKSSSEESLKEKRHTFIGVFPFHLAQYANTVFMS